MTSEAILKQLQFSQEWLDLGIVTPALLAKLWREYETGTDVNSEHYRWRVFHSFLKAHQEIPAPLQHALYRLSQQDPDAHATGRAMRIELLKRDDCPVDLLQLAAHAQEKSVARFARKILLMRTGDQLRDVPNMTYNNPELRLPPC